MVIEINWHARLLRLELGTLVRHDPFSHFRPLEFFLWCFSSVKQNSVIYFTVHFNTVQHGWGFAKSLGYFVYILYLRICIFLYLCTSTSERSFQVNVSHKGPEIGTGEATKGFLINPAAKPQKTTSSSRPKPKATKQNILSTFLRHKLLFSTHLLSGIGCYVSCALWSTGLL